ncbi:MAG: hypothetical protein C5B50_06260 [Verrucomicrobia bacterium]|nr:MAG: hypothetical protein C5B50_06260 [Verrucomicrobiota bacterium]
MMRREKGGILSTFFWPKFSFPFPRWYGLSDGGWPGALNSVVRAPTCARQRAQQSCALLAAVRPAFI